MVQLTTRNTALVLYGVLLVLPTLVLGGLHWHQLRSDHEAALAAVPGDAADAARRLTEAMKRRLSDLVEREEVRPFYHYKKSYFPPGTIGAELAFVPSPLASGPVPQGVLGWFSYRASSEPETSIEVYGGDRANGAGWSNEAARLARAVRDLIDHDRQEVIWIRTMRMRSMRTDLLPLPAAAINLSPEEDVDCLRDELPALRNLQTESTKVHVFAMHLRFYVEPDGTPRILASRTVLVDPDKRLREMPSCFDNLGWGASLVQGFFIDPRWLFTEMPSSLARQVLDVTQEFVPFGSAAPRPLDQTEVIKILPVKELGFETYHKADESYGELEVVMNTRDLETRFRSQSLHFFGVAAMLILSLSTGMALLLRSVRRDLEAARRTENFVAAVTHELRTPLSSIRLYGEMLQDGWVEDPEKRAEYYRRIVRETGRLETLVERVLEKSQITSNEARPEPGDLNRVLAALAPSLCEVGNGRDATDLVFELAPELPPVLLNPEGVRSIVANLVENARKYAPVPVGVASAEPIRVVTRLVHGNVVLEVKDRGPGIPPAEKSRIFEAFYRVGNEATRTARGTGLGLHLVALQAQAMQARVQALDRKGGGTVFRVTFRTAANTTDSGIA